METTNAIVLETMRRRGASASPDSPRGLSVMSLYQDETTQKRASATCQAVINGTPLTRKTAWKLSDLSQSGVLAGAVHMAMRADVIVVSLTSGGGLPLPFYVWMNMWLPYRQVAGGKLILLLGNSNGDFSNHVVEYLHEAARQANLQFEAHLVTRSRPGDKAAANSRPLAQACAAV
jgi:hypothetical protein